jgi:hypothetical protein
MSKLDKKELKESQIPNSRSRKKKEHKDAQAALEYAKKIIVNTFLAKQGDCQFSRMLKKNKKAEIDLEGFYNSKDAAAYLNLGHPTFYNRAKVFNLPFKLIGKKKYFSQETLDDHKNNTVFKGYKRKN